VSRGTPVEWSIRAPIAKQAIDEKRRLVFGIASRIEAPDGMPIHDHEGDIIPTDVMERAVYAYVERHRAADVLHRERPVGHVVESFILTPAKRQIMSSVADLGIADVGVVFWWVGFRVTDESVWTQIMSGELTEFSVGGTTWLREMEVESVGPTA